MVLPHGDLDSIIGKAYQAQVDHVSVALCRASHSRVLPRRLLEGTFRLDVKAAREYCEADERWLGAVAFLDNDGGAGWDLLGAMLCPQWRQRPTAESCLNHPFLKEEVP